MTDIFPVKDTNLFKGVTDDDKYAEALVRKELHKEKEQLDQQKADIEKKLKNFEETVKIEKAKKNFIPKKDFLIREQLDRMENFIINLNELLKGTDKEAIETLMRRELYNIYGMNIYLGSDNRLDILYDIGASNLYKKIKDNNANSDRNNEKLREIEIREANWVQFSSKKPRKGKNRNH